MKALASLVSAVIALCVATAAWGFDLSSPDIANGSLVQARQVYSGLGCKGDNLSPALAWHDPPTGSSSFAITVFDSDAPTGSGWWHWVMFNIPATVKKLELNAGDPRTGRTPMGTLQGVNDFGKPGYGGPCPPLGDKPHRYVFTVFALAVDSLPFDSRTPDRTVGRYLDANALGKASFTATYGR